MTSLTTPETPVKTFQPGDFDGHRHWYPRALNATIHPMVSYFFNLSPERILARYCHLNPAADRQYLEELLSFRPKFFPWSGSDLIHVTTNTAKRQMVVIETNSCPSGQKSMPLLDDTQEMGGYARLMAESFRHFLRGKRLIENGLLAVIYDKNPVEASGYAAAMAQVFNEPVRLIRYMNGEANEHVKVAPEDGTLYLHEAGEWKPLRAVFRYVTQKPWNRLPIQSRTVIYNPIIACLAGGRNKMLAAKAYEFFNAELKNHGLQINMPETIWDVSKNEIPLWVSKLGGRAVIKIPYSNAGQGVFIVTSPRELDEFMAQDFEYDQFIVQSLIGNYKWSSLSEKGQLYHIGTVPNKRNETFVFDLRFMVCSTKEGMRPVAIYARSAATPLAPELTEETNSWTMLGTNLSVKLGVNDWTSDTERLLLMDRRDFNRIGVGLDDLVQGYIQTILGNVAIDKMAQRLIGPRGKLKPKLFRSLNPDAHLIEEILG